MNPRRRRLLLSFGVGGLSSVAGCINVPDSGSGDGSGDDGSSEGGGSDTDQEAEEDESEDESLSPRLQVYLNQLQSAYEFLSWRSDSYDQVISSYEGEVQEDIELLEQLKEAEFDDLTQDDIDNFRESAGSTQDLIGDGLGEYYYFHFWWDSFINDRVDDLSTQLERSEEDAFIATVDESLRLLRNRASNINLYYPNAMIWRVDPFVRFTNSQAEYNDENEVENLGKEDGQVNTDLLFEGGSVGVSDESFFASGGFRVKTNSTPLNHSTNGFESDHYSTSSDRDVGVLDAVDWFSRPGENEEHYVINMYQPNEEVSYPDYIAGFGDSLGEVSTLVLDDITSVGVSIQKFESSDQAGSVYGDITSQGETDGTSTHFGVTYQRVFYVSDSSETFYVDLANIGSMVIGVNPTTTPWESREYPVDGDGEMSEVEYMIRGSFLDPNSNNIE